MASKFLIQVVEKDTGKVVQWAPGFPVERQLSDELCARVAKLITDEGVGIFKTQAKVVGTVQDAVQVALKAILYELKADVVMGR